MSPPHPWRGSPPPCNPSLAAEHTHNLYFMMGQALSKIDSIDACLKDGSQVMARHDREIAALRKPDQADKPTGWELALKRPLPFVIGFLALGATGHLELVVRMIESLAKISEHL